MPPGSFCTYPASSRSLKSTTTKKRHWLPDMEIVSQIGASTLNGLSYIGSLASLGARGLFHLGGPVSRKAPASATRDIASHGHRRPRLADPFPDYLLHWPDPRAAGGLRTSQIWRDKRRGNSGGCHDVRRAPPLNHRHRSGRTFRCCLRC